MSRLIDWSIAGRAAWIAAGGSGERPAPAPLRSVVEDCAQAVEGYTGLTPAQQVPEPEWVSRREWAEINLASLSDSLEPLAESLGLDKELTGPLSGAAGRGLGAVAGAQLGVLIGYASRHVLGQYELPILGPEREPRLLFLYPNIEEAREGLGGEGETVMRWIALHEVTHAVHLGSAPWLRAHLRGLARSLLEGSRLGVSPRELAETARRVVTSDPRETMAALRNSDPVTLLTPPRSRPLLEDTQATMASIEGYAEHVMDAAAPMLGEEIGELRSAMERRRADRPPLARLLAWLLGLELKMRQYRDGKRFSDGVVELAGIEALNHAWEGPEALPTLAELADPGRWLERTPTRVG
jgi:coenzyme F420 biosynthesis associated uncharacterized protein